MTTLPKHCIIPRGHDGPCIFEEDGTLAKQLAGAKADLAFALAQGDGYAEDAAAARVRQLERETVARG